MGLRVTEILGIVCQRMTLGEFSLIDHNMTDRDGPARSPATQFCVMETFRKLDQDVK